jgi:polysaccharide export outer membrane protein
MRTLLTLLLATPWLIAPGRAQTTVQDQPQAAPLVAVQNLPQLEIGGNDLLNINVYDSPELSGTLRVDADGNLALPMLGDSKPVHVAGLFPEQVAALITKALETAQLVVHARVTVKVAEYQSRTVTVVGAVRHPLSFQAYGHITLLDAIGRADGLTDSAGDQILVTSAQEGGLTHLNARINVSDLMSGKVSRDNVVLHGGEEIRIPEEGHVSVLGDVKHPGVFPLKTADESTLLTLIARSEGLIPNASNIAYIYRDRAPGQARAEVRVELKSILDRKAPDVHLEPGDILYVPDNHTRRVTLAILEHLSSAATATAGAVAYAGAR